MKYRLLTPIIVGITALLTFWMFLDFQKKWKAASPFQYLVTSASLSMRHLLISPKQLGIEAWKTGAYAAYELKTNTYEKNIAFHLTVPDTKNHNIQWLKTEGLISFNGVNVDIWKSLNVKSLRPGSETAEFFFAQHAIPFRVGVRSVWPYPVSLEHVGEENVETPIGTFKCQHYFAQLQSPDGNHKPLLELWTNPSVLPLGIVRARWQDEVLELVETQPPTPIEIPEMLAKMMNSHTLKNAETDDGQLVSVCTQCHEGKIGGKHLKLESLTTLSGTELALKESLHHYYAAGLTEADKPLALFLASKGDKQKQARFTWAKGSFWVKSDAFGRLVLSLDETAHQGNVRVATPKGRLVLSVSEKEF